MLVEKIEQIASNLGFEFKYGKDHWQNLGDWPDDADLPLIDRKKYMQLLWKDRTGKMNGYGAEEGCTFDGEFVLSVRSRLSDPDYKFKYDTHIKGLEALLQGVQDKINDCDGLTLKGWKETEVENLYDANMDGLKVTFKIEKS